jgi:2-hydroxycyclohexanecarboxyl-CoA dehydrogenase
MADEVRPVAVVTGGAKGIGAAICDRMAGDGFAVAVVDIDEGAASERAASLAQASWHSADVGLYQSVRTAVDAVVERWGRIDVLVNNAGWDRVQPFLQNEPDLWDRLVDVNLKGPINLCHASLPHMISEGSGAVVNVASDAGRVGSSGEAVYSACKGGVIALTKALAREVARHGIRVNCVCPGPTDTPLLAEIRSEESGDRIIEAIVRATPLRRLATPEDIAGAVAFFASTAASFVTGQVLSVSGGLTMSG